MKRPKINRTLQISLDSNEFSCMLTYADFKYKKTQGHVSHYKNGLTDVYLSSRNRFILHLFDSTNIRVSEMCGLKISDLNLESNEFYIREKGNNNVLKYIVTKGGKESARDFFQDRTYFHELKKNNLENPEYLFHSRNGLPLQQRTLRSMVCSYALAAGIKKSILGRTHVSPHALRRTGARILHDEGASLEDIQVILGHQSPATTRIYLSHSVGVNNTREIMKKNHPRAD